MLDGESTWKSLRRTLRRAERKFRDGDPEGLHDLRVALRHTAVVAEAGARPKVARGASKLARRLSPLRQLEVDRELLAELGRSGEVSPRDARPVDEILAARQSRLRDKALKRLSAARERRLFERLGHDRQDGPLASRLALETGENALRVPRVLDDEGLHRLRISVKRRRYALMARRDLGAPGLEEEISRCRSLQDSLGRANDWRSFLRDLVRLRESRHADPGADSPLDAIFDPAADRAEIARKAACEAVAASGLVPDREPRRPQPPSPPPDRDAALFRGSPSLLRDDAIRSRSDS